MKESHLNMNHFTFSLCILTVLCALTACAKQVSAPIQEAEIVSDTESASETAKDSTEQQAIPERAPEIVEVPEPATQDEMPADSNTVDNREPVTCGNMTLDAADAEKWECVPEIGFWCTDTAGCPVKGNKVIAGTQLRYAMPLPDGKGYQFRAEYPDGLKPMQISSRPNSPYYMVADWKCNEANGCVCGSGKVKKNGVCLNDVYEAADAAPGADCNATNCPAYCRNQQCVCGDTIVTNDSAKSFKCDKDVMVCMDKSGCKDKQKNYALNDVWGQFKLVCKDNEGCQCGTATCRESDVCYLSENKCVSYSEYMYKVKVPKGYYITEKYNRQDRTTQYHMICSQKNGCKCGSQLCPEGFECSNDVCVFQHEENEYDPPRTDLIEVSYCDRPEGCICGSKRSLCPNGAFCKHRGHDIGAIIIDSYECFTSDEVTIDTTAGSKAIFDFWKKAQNESASKAFWSDKKMQRGKIIFDEVYYPYSDLKEKRDYRLFIQNGKQIAQNVVCSQTGCTCGATRLDEHYLCLKQTIDVAQKDYGTYCTCNLPFSDSNNNPFGCEMCKIRMDATEPVCNDPSGCKCGSDTIKMGQACIDGKPQCVSLRQTSFTRGGTPGWDVAPCLCGDKPLENDYGCYQKKPICLSRFCICDGKKISYGDVCAGNHVVLCGEYSNTRGCYCGKNELRKDYRCLNNEQICDCREDEDSENDCTCKCGKTSIHRGEVCGNDDKPAIHTVTKNEDGSRTLKCGSKTLRFPVESDDAYCRDNDDGTLCSSMYDQHRHKLSIDRYIDQEVLCTCGTETPIPGKDYGCAFKEDMVGKDSEWEYGSYLVGYQCLNFDGCKCGTKTCQPGDLCQKRRDGSHYCEPFKTFDGSCANHQLPTNKVAAWGYGCYAPSQFTQAPGWYCKNAEGCPCGDVSCEQWQMCLAPGYCSKNKLDAAGQSVVNQNKSLIRQVQRDDQ